MANYQLLKADIDKKVYQNGKQEITGANLNSVLNAMVASLGVGYQFMGMATPTNPGTAQTADYKCFYLATTPGTYTNLGGLVVADGEVAILKWDAAWTKEVTGAATADQVNQLSQGINHNTSNTSSQSIHITSDSGQEDVIKITDGGVEVNGYIKQNRAFTPTRNEVDKIKEHLAKLPIDTNNSLDTREKIVFESNEGDVEYTDIQFEKEYDSSDSLIIGDNKKNKIVEVTPDGVNVNGTLKNNGSPILSQADVSHIEDEITTINGEIVDLQQAVGASSLGKVNSVAFPDLPITIMSNTDAESTSYDNVLIGYNNILKISDSMYYLYYSGMGEIGQGDTDQRLCFAYSTDGFTYTRGFPTGVEAPVPGTNILADFNLREQVIFKVQDETTPYRMIANDASYNMMLYKSPDAIHFDFEHGKKCCNGTRDCQVSAIVRGNIIKLYVRGVRYDELHPNGTRAVDVAYCDIDGNIVSPAVVALPVNSLYQASASYLDDHREILFPSFYNDNRPTTQPGGMGGDDSMALRCYIVSGDNYQEVQLDTSRILTNADKAVYVSPYLIDINNNLYFLMCVNNKTHNEPYAGEISTFKLVKVQLNSI